MTEIVNVGEAKSSLSSLIKRALDGEQIIIARAGVPAVELVVVEQAPERTFGMNPHLAIPDEALFAPLSDEDLALWERA